MSKDQILDIISKEIEDLTGLSYPKSRWGDLERCLNGAMDELCFSNSLIELKLKLENRDLSADQLNILCNHLTVGETYFFRDCAILDIFGQNLIPELLAERFGKEQHIRIWSAGCCTGEEPYTLAMLLDEIVPEIEKWDISILATDLNPFYLEKAKNGFYNNWSFRNTPNDLKLKYFEPYNSQFRICDKIKNIVDFKQLNLKDESALAQMASEGYFDIIFCRNVLMYFSGTVIKQIGRCFAKALNNNGWLVTSAVELNDELFEDFTKVRFEANFVYRKICLKAPSSGGKKVEIVDNPVKPLLQAKGLKNKTVSKVTPPEKIKVSHHQPLTSLSKQPDPDEALVLFTKGNYTGCRDYCKSRITKGEANNTLYPLLIKSCANLGELDEALEYCSKWLEVNRFNAECYFLKANVLVEKRLISEAIVTLRQGLYLDPDHLMSHVMMVHLIRSSENSVSLNLHLKNVKRILNGLDDNVVLKEAEGLTVGRILEMIK